MTDPLIDTTVAHYHVLARLGGGAMGIVYKARDTRLGRLVALKFLPPEWSHDEHAKQRFIREAQAASSTDHANICTVHDIQTADDGRLFIVMACYEGQTLKQRLAEGPIGIEQALDIATQVADGLARAHAAGVVHRDVKPGNLILTDDAVKIVDFGLATLAGTVQLTQAGTPMGTVSYMSPEQLRGLGANAQSDVWAVGVILYEMLAGHPPFQGAYAEAVSYAIRHETPALLRPERPEIPEEVEQLVFRALHKEAGVRFASGRELARALRQVQGHSVPLELQTGVVRVPMRAAPPRPWRVPRTWLWTAAALALVAGVGVAWIAFWRPPRAFVAVAPVVNATGDRTLDPYRLGLTLALTRELGVSPDIRVFPYQQMLQPLRRFLLAGADPSGADAVAAIGASSGAPVVIVPTLSYDRGAWTAQADLRDPKAGTSVGRVQTDALESSLTKEAAATLIARLAATVEARFARTRWWPGSVAPPVRFQSLDAARAFEEGVNAYDAAEFASARDAFGRAAREDPRHPLPVAWSSRIAQIVGDRNAAAEAADRAEGLLSTASSGDRLFVEAVVAESRRQIENAARAYQALADATPDDTSGWLELAAFDDRSGRTAEAIATYRQVLDADARLPGPALELCRLYNSTRMNDATQARAFGDQARRGYANLGSTAGEAQAKLCLADILRGGTPEERAQARRLSAEALAAFQGLGLRYGVARAQHYVAMTARAQDDLVAAAASWEQALASAKAVGNTSLEGTVYTNLGVTHNALGNRGKALDYYRQSYEMAERRGDERRAAYSRANAGALLIEYGDAPDEGLRFIEGALRVVRRLEDKNFEVFCLQLISVHYRFTGRYADARAAIDQAIAIARERNFVDAIPALLLEQGRVRMEMGEYVAARETFTQALGSEGATEAGELQIELARVQARLGDAEAAASALEKAQMSPEANAGDVEPRLLAAAGEVAYAAGRLQDARASYEAAGRLWTDELPDAASVEGRAFVGLLDALDGRAAGRPAIDTGLQQARRMQRPSLEALCRMWLARLDLRAGRPAQAASLLAPIRLDRIGPELQAQVHYWRAQASATPGAGDDERRDARRLLDEIQRGVPDRLRARFLLRPDIQVMAN